MGRTRLRGIELSGTRVAVEAPPQYAWDWPSRGLAQLACAPVEPDVYIGVSVGVISPPEWDPITYSYDGGTFDVGRVGDEWWVAIHRAGRRFERVARFDRTFREGDITISPDAIANCRHPLDGPLFDLLLTHRLIVDGGMVLSGRAVVESGRAMALLTPGDACAGGSEAPSNSAPRRGRARVAETPGGRFGLRIRDGVVRVHGLPGSSGHPGAAVSGRLDAIHVLTRSRHVFAEPIDTEESIHELVQHACAPLHAPDMAEQLLEAAAAIGASVPVLKVGVPEEKRVVSFDWSRRETALGFALPILG